MNISVIVPVLNEEKSIQATLHSLMRLKPHEIIVVDGGSRDQTRAICGQFPIKLASADRGRARQMNSGASRASGDILLFLHADSQLPISALRDITAVLSDPRYVAGRFDVELAGAHWMLKIIAALINYRSRATKIATGDQALFVRREVFDRIGGGVACLRSRVITSARRWERDGVWRTIFKMWSLKVCYLAGVSPMRLKRFYADTR